MVQLLFISSCSEDVEDPISATGALKTKEVKYDKNIQFNTLELNSGIIGHVEFDENLTESVVTIETNENILEYVEVVQNGKSLSLKLKDKKYGDNIVVKCNIKTNKIGNLKLTGKSTITIDNILILDTLVMDISGNSKVVGQITCGYVDLKLTGNSKAELTGNATTTKLNLSGESIFSGFDFFVNDFIGEFSGNSVASISINSKLSITASGSSILNYKGNPEILLQVLSGGSVINKL